MLCKHCVFLPWSVWTWLRREAAHKDWGMWMGKGRKEKFCSGWPACLFTSWGKPHGRASLGKYFLIVTFQGSFSFFFFFGFCAYRKWEGKKKSSYLYGVPLVIWCWIPHCKQISLLNCRAMTAQPASVASFVIQTFFSNHLLPWAWRDFSIFSCFDLDAKRASLYANCNIVFLWGLLSISLKDKASDASLNWGTWKLQSLNTLKLSCVPELLSLLRDQSANMHIKVQIKLFGVHCSKRIIVQIIGDFWRSQK